MLNIYNKNGLVFWNKQQIRLRRFFEDHLSNAVEASLKKQNKAWEFFQIEAPLLTPVILINDNYTQDDFYLAEKSTGPDSPDLVLRPETTMGSYALAVHMLNSQKTRMPLCVWQHGKSFRKEQDQPTKNMRLKEFYQLEFQCIFSANTKNDYSIELIPDVQRAIMELIGPCHVENSDRLPDYAEWTKDIICDKNQMEVCSISLRKDFPIENTKVLEVAVGTDRCVFNFMEKI